MNSRMNFRLLRAAYGCRSILREVRPGTKKFAKSDQTATYRTWYYCRYFLRVNINFKINTWKSGRFSTVYTAKVKIKVLQKIRNFKARIEGNSVIDHCWNRHQIVALDEGFPSVYGSGGLGGGLFPRFRDLKTAGTAAVLETASTAAVLGLENEGKDGPPAHPTHIPMESPRRGLQSDVHSNNGGIGCFLRFWPWSCVIFAVL